MIKSYHDFISIVKTANCNHLQVSFLRKQESRPSLCFHQKIWIPVFAGMTEKSILRVISG